MKTISGFALPFIMLTALALVLPAWAQNTEWQTRPVELGTSGGNINDISKLYCCSGTLGSLVQDINGVQYILSNNHVLAKTNKGSVGDDIIQQGLIDQSPACYKDNNDAVADLSKFVPILFRGKTNRVDAAVAQVRNAAVDTSGSVLQIGQISNVTAAPAIGTQVKKSGRTTGLTQGMISAVNVTVNVTYNKQCGIGSQTAKFTGQFMVNTAGFSSGGDSGSVIVEDCGEYPRAVGLLFAGSDTVTVANPINEVLSALAVGMTGAGAYCYLTVPATGDTSSAPSFLPPQASKDAVDAITRVKERNENIIFAVDGVVGTGVGISGQGQPVIEVYVKKPVNEMRPFIPHALENIPVIIVETGEIIAD